LQLLPPCQTTGSWRVHFSTSATRSAQNTVFCHDYFISQGSAATHLRFGGIFKDRFTKNFPGSVQVKDVFNRSISGKDMTKTWWRIF